MIGFAQGESSYQFRSAFINTVWPVWAIGIASMIFHLLAAFSFHFSGKVIKKYHPLPTLIFGKLYSLASNALALIFPNLASPILLSSNSSFFGTGTVAMSQLLQSEYTSKQRSTMGSLNSLFGSFAFALVAFTLGLFADVLGPAKALLPLQLLAIISLTLVWRLFHQTNSYTIIQKSSQ